MFAGIAPMLAAVGLIGCMFIGGTTLTLLGLL